MSNREKQKVSTTAIGTCIMRATSYYEDCSYYNSTFAAGNWEISLDVIGQGRHPVV